VIYVTIELRQSSFFGWLRDLSQPDPSSLFNAFACCPGRAGASLAARHHLHRPAADPLGISMWLQQKLNPAPADQVQAQIFAWMPWIFMSCWATSPLAWCCTGSQQHHHIRAAVSDPVEPWQKAGVFGNIRGRPSQAVAANVPTKPSVKAVAAKPEPAKPRK